MQDYQRTTDAHLGLDRTSHVGMDTTIFGPHDSGGRYIVMYIPSFKLINSTVLQRQFHLEPVTIDDSFF